MDIFTKQIYWHAPVWELLLILLATIGLMIWLYYRTIGRKAIWHALRQRHPVFEHQPLYFYTRSNGIESLNEVAQHMLDNLHAVEHKYLLAAFIDVAAEALTEGRLATQTNWGQQNQMLSAIPFFDGADTPECVLLTITKASISNTIPPIPISIPVASIPPSTPPQPFITENTINWIYIGKDLQIHPEQPIVQVRRATDSSNRTGLDTVAWQIEELTYLEEKLLRYMHLHLNETQQAEDLFLAVWPDDEVDRVGLRPDQKDRLRRLVFNVRKHVEPTPRTPLYLQTAHGMGYTLYGS